MNKKEKEETLNYFAKVFGNKEDNYGGKIRKGTHCFGFPTKECKLLGIRRTFGDGSDWIKCSQYETVISGEGNEEEKIDSAFSSSLQSLLFFAKTEEKGVKIRFDEKDYVFKKAVFEYKNKVIGYPSSVDVVLIDEAKKAICFVESKLLEIVRDSNETGKAEVGVSYYAKDGVGFNETLGLTIGDLKDLGIRTPKDDDYLEIVKGSGIPKQVIEPIRDNKFVYSYGIKQVLSHLIGIASFQKRESAYGSESVDPIPAKDRAFEKCFYLQLYNELPGFSGDKDAKRKLDDFKKHFEAVRDVVMNKDQRPVDGMYIMTYQDLFQDLFEENKGLVNDVIRDYYHLGGE